MGAVYPWKGPSYDSMTWSDNFKFNPNYVNIYLPKIISYLTLEESSIWHFHITTFVVLSYGKLKFTLTIIFVVIWPLVNDKCPGYSSDFTGNLRARKPNISQTKWANITGVQEFFGIVSRVYAWMNSNDVNFILSSLSSLHPHYFPELQFSPLLLTEYSTSWSGRSHDRVRVLRPWPLNRPIWQWYTLLLPSLSDNHCSSVYASGIAPASTSDKDLPPPQNFSIRHQPMQNMRLPLDGPIFEHTITISPIPVNINRPP